MSFGLHSLMLYSHSLWKLLLLLAPASHFVLQSNLTEGAQNIKCQEQTVACLATVTVFTVTWCWNVSPNPHTLSQNCLEKSGQMPPISTFLCHSFGLHYDNTAPAQLSSPPLTTERNYLYLVLLINSSASSEPMNSVSLSHTHTAFNQEGDWDGVHENWATGSYSHVTGNRMWLFPGLRCPSD